MSFQDTFESCRGASQEYLNHYWSRREGPRSRALQYLSQSVEYSLLGSGKRFRPVLALLVSDAFAGGPHRVLPFAAAVEMIHTYSLIHDDLPCMDNDDFRRGVLTNHKAFNESTALLAGDALLTEAFLVIAENYSKEPELGLNLVRLLSEAAGFSGMVGGQAIDLSAKESGLAIQELNLMHAMKTGALIRVAAEGVAHILGLPQESRQKVRRFGEKLGLAFQLKDDLLDSSEKVEKGSFPELLGIEQTESYLQEVTQEAQILLQELSIEGSPLAELLQMNLKRDK
jgi:geranylgeranyl diphosphate synthase, type II